jgi:hypothetical protein
MANYLLIYHGGSAPQAPEEQQKVLQAWTGWFTSMGQAVVDGGNPVGQAKTVASNGSVSDGGGANPVTGYSIIQANSIDEAVEKAKGSPQLTSGGTIEVCETFQIM